MHLNIYDFDGVIATTKARKHLFDDWKNAPADKHEQAIELLSFESVSTWFRKEEFKIIRERNTCRNIILTANSERFRRDVQYFLVENLGFSNQGVSVFKGTRASHREFLYMHPYPRVDIAPDVWKAQFIKRYVEMHSYIESVDFYDDSIANIEAVKRMVHETGYDFIKCHLVERE